MLVGPRQSRCGGVGGCLFVVGVGITLRMATFGMVNQIPVVGFRIDSQRGIVKQASLSSANGDGGVVLFGCNNVLFRLWQQYPLLDGYHKKKKKILADKMTEILLDAVFVNQGVSRAR